jgi:hypothetical protein
MDATSANTSGVRHNVLLTFFAEGSESDPSRSTVAWQGGAHPSLAGMPNISEGVPSATDRVQIECIRWEDTDKLTESFPSRHVRYVVKVTAPGLDPYQLPKRWQEISDLSKNLYKYDRVLSRKFRWQADGEKPLPTKRTSAGYDAQRLERRQTEINVFFQQLSAWMNRLLERSGGPKGGPINLLDQPTQGGYPDLIARFFSRDATYDQAKDTLRDIHSIGLGAVAGS